MSGASYTHAEWVAEAKRLFPSREELAFICPVCCHVATVAEYKKAGAPDGAIGFSCVGRYVPRRNIHRLEGSRDALTGDGRGPCNYAGGGLLQLNPVTVTFPNGDQAQYFDFAREEL